jgi:general secretion pathway protein I
MKGHRAFTLLEVMVAVLILSISLASLFSAQTQAVGASQFIKHVAVASQLARCRMSEIELEMLREGFELAEFGDWEEGPCCELRDERVTLTGIDPFSCRWRLETVTLPSMTDVQTEAGDAIMEGNQEAQQGMMSMSLLGPFLPIVQNLLEQAIRRVTVQVVWSEGPHERDVEIVQYLTNPNQGSLGGLLRQTQGQRAVEDAESEGLLPNGTSTRGSGNRGSSTGTSMGRPQTGRGQTGGGR